MYQLDELGEQEELLCSGGGEIFHTHKKTRLTVDPGCSLLRYGRCGMIRSRARRLVTGFFFIVCGGWISQGCIR